MKKVIKVALLASAVSAMLMGCSSRNDTYHLPINAVYQMPEAKDKLDPSIQMAFGKKLSGSVVKTAATNKKTNALNKSDEEACRWAMLSAMIQLQNKASQLGVKKVSNIVSYYKKQTYTSSTKYECHAGRSVAGVALKADFVR